uniref:Glycosyl transferase family 25 domain-containing protein n=2 Tax=Amorphochlora amoebiformis TaxID=1561963 RepID=A0A7S0DSR7_9EUKA|mmetsp:Transcript_509/g.756  ORF Transcript_509/g.756 Transcript_509/m.756 type:complete len:437 (+) Transcript_509:33-1343(+)
MWDEWVRVRATLTFVCIAFALVSLISPRDSVLTREAAIKIFRSLGKPANSSSESLCSLTAEEETFLATLECCERTNMRDQTYLLQHVGEISERTEYDGVDVQTQHQWLRNARARLARFPALDDDLLPVAPGGKELVEEIGKNVFVVSLERRPLKRRDAVRRLVESRLGGYIVNAIDGDGITTKADLAAIGAGVFPGYQGHDLHNISLTTGEAGCFLSHYSIWHHIHKNRLPYALVLEDDFEILGSPETFREGVRKLLDEAKASAGGKWDILYLSRYPITVDHKRISRSLVIPGFSYWTVAYIISLNGARKLLNKDGVRNMIGLDDWFSVLSKEPIESLACAPYTDRYRRFFACNLRRLAAIQPLIMPAKGAFWLSDTAKMRKNTRVIDDLPEGKGLENYDLRLPVVRPWRKTLRAFPGSVACRAGVKPQGLVEVVD